MKAKYVLATIGLVTLFCSCNKENEVPPYQKTVTDSYIMPSPEPLTAEERVWLNDLRKEYNDAIKGQ